VTFWLTNSKKPKARPHDCAKDPVPTPDALKQPVVSNPTNLRSNVIQLIDHEIQRRQRAAA